MVETLIINNMIKIKEKEAILPDLKTYYIMCYKFFKVLGEKYKNH